MKKYTYLYIYFHLQKSCNNLLFLLYDSDVYRKEKSDYCTIYLYYNNL